jgi:hypothetical protein
MRISKQKLLNCLEYYGQFQAQISFHFGLSHAITGIDSEPRPSKTLSSKYRAPWYKKAARYDCSSWDAVQLFQQVHHGRKKYNNVRVDRAGSNKSITALNRKIENRDLVNRSSWNNSLRSSGSLASSFTEVCKWNQLFSEDSTFFLDHSYQKCSRCGISRQRVWVCSALWLHAISSNYDITIRYNWTFTTILENLMPN